MHISAAGSSIFRSRIERKRAGEGVDKLSFSAHFGQKLSTLVAQSASATAAIQAKRVQICAPFGGSI
jgi:hypothetical protein